MHTLGLETPTAFTRQTFWRDFALKPLADDLSVPLAPDTEPYDAASPPNQVYVLGALKPIFADCLLALDYDQKTLPTGLE